MQTRIIAVTANAIGKFFSGIGARYSGMFGAGRSPTLVPVMMNFESSVEGACGTVIFWKHVGHSIFVPACDESHRICWPHTGQAYLNSLMAAAETFHIHRRTATPIFRSESSSFSFSSSPSVVFLFEDEHENDDDDKNWGIKCLCVLAPLR